MKPGDHPDFFRLPPPPGRSRESTIRLDAEGRFHHDGAPVEHAAMAAAFAGWIARHPDDGRFILNNGYDWTYFHVEDTPYFVERVRATPDGLVLGLFDGTEEPLDGATLRLDGQGRVRARVKSGAFEAKFTRDAQLSLAPFLEESQDGKSLFLVISGARHALPPA
jgi:uncharacterized protein